MQNLRRRRGTELIEVAIPWPIDEQSHHLVEKLLGVAAPVPSITRSGSGRECGTPSPKPLAYARKRNGRCELSHFRGHALGSGE